jgi:hypothetical protein
VPNGHAEEMERVRRRSRLWGVVWQVGDAAYWFGLMGSVVLPVAFLVIGLRHLESWAVFRRHLVAAAVFLLGSYPAGFVVCVVLKRWARRRTGGE